MRYAFLIVVLSMPVFAFAQYRGGINDGVARGSASLQNALPSIYSGGANDGHSAILVANQNATPGIYTGGTNDGVASINVTNQNAIPGIYSGGANDGVAVLQATSQNATPQIYTGGINDGVAIISVTNQNAQPSIYAGGPNDGVGFAQRELQNALPEIYAGGTNDGYAFIVAQHQNKSVSLPVTLLTFTGEWFNDDAVLAWRTGEERSLDHFEMERSDDEGRSFSTIGSVPPNTRDQPEYRYTDVRAYYLPTDILFYRLKSVDMNGDFRYSAIVRLSKDKTQPAIVAYPNPTSGRFTLAMLNVTDVSGYGYVLTGIDGKIITRGTIQQTTTSFDLGGNAASTYHLVLFKDGKQVQHFTILLTP